MTALPANLSPDFPAATLRRALRAVVWATLLFADAARSGPVAAATPTYARDVAALLFENCTGCHRAGEVAARLPLLSYDDARRLSRGIKDSVTTRTMPPWFADPAHSLKFANDPRLSQGAIDTLVAWVDGGSPEGNAAEAPPAPGAEDGWRHPQGSAPDLVLSLPEFTVPATGEIPYVQQRVKVMVPKDRWIAAMQVRPGNAALVHHMGITEVSLAGGIDPAQLEGFEKMARQMGFPDGSLSMLQPAVKDPVNRNAYDMLGVYTPGTTIETYGNDSAKLLKAGATMYINFNIHYTATGKAEKDRSQLALWFQPGPPRHQLFRAPAAVSSLIVNGKELLTDDPGTKAEGTDFAIPPIPPHDENYELSGVTAYAEPLTIYQLQPHAHMRAKDFTYSAVYPDGREVTLLSVPHYDFHWQLAYQLAKPLTLPAGSKLVVTAHYDNSANNAHLRSLTGELARNCGPDKEAYFRRENQSWHEMFSPFVQYALGPRDPHASAAAQAAPAPRTMPIAEVVGCLTQDGPHEWRLTRAGEPSMAATQSTSAAALGVAATRPYGKNAYRLLGTSVFKPQDHGNQKVAVKGILLRGAAESRLNVTSLQPLSGACDRAP